MVWSECLSWSLSSGGRTGLRGVEDAKAKRRSGLDRIARFAVVINNDGLSRPSSAAMAEMLGRSGTPDVGRYPRTIAPVPWYGAGVRFRSRRS